MQKSHRILLAIYYLIEFKLNRAYFPFRDMLCFLSGRRMCVGIPLQYSAQIEMLYLFFK
nr:MAG TPA: inhibitor [Caudoviricetes sp.]